MLSSREIRQKFLDFFATKGHAIIPSASLIPEHDPTVLFTTAGMQPLIPYLLGEKHPGGTRLANSQKCIRTQDIDEIGDERHDTFFEMLGNWSLGDYFKTESIAWSYELLTSKKWLALDPNKISVSVFAGDKDAPKDEEAAQLWLKAGIPAQRIYYYGKKDNWWGPVGDSGPCGPDTEIFYDTGKAMHDGCQPSCGCGKYLEIWNNVFMQYSKHKDGTFTPLAQKNVDTGMGLERVVMVLQNKQDIFETDLFAPIMAEIRKIATTKDIKAERIVADHIRTATFILADDQALTPSNVDRGYILRRLIRRAVRYARNLGIEGHFAGQIAQVVINNYKDIYTELGKNHERVIQELEKEEEKFSKTLAMGLKEFSKLENHIDGKTAFNLFATYGFPIEITKELAAEKGLTVDESKFNEEMKQHQDLSRKGAEQKFKGGLADHSVESTRYHTATHLLHKALRDTLGTHVEQRGSNITKERLRFDFSHPDKMTPDQIKKVEDTINARIAADLPVSWAEMSVDEAKSQGAMGLFEEKYGDKIKVYSIGDYSKEICGGPHVQHTGELGEAGKFKILKEEAVSAGIRRIKAVLQK